MFWENGTTQVLGVNLVQATRKPVVKRQLKKSRKSGSKAVKNRGSEQKYVPTK